MVTVGLQSESDSLREQTETGEQSDEFVGVVSDRTAIAKSILDRYRDERQAAGRAARERDELFAEWDADLPSDMTPQSTTDGFAASLSEQRAARRQAWRSLTARMTANAETDKPVQAVRREPRQASEEESARDTKRLERQVDQQSRDAFYASLGEETPEAKAERAE